MMNKALQWLNEEPHFEEGTHEILSNAKYQASKIKNVSDAKQQRYFSQRASIAKQAAQKIESMQVKTEALNYLLKK